jgi:hypothetical protein
MHSVPAFRLGGKTHLNRNSERIPRRFCLPMAMAGTQ